MALLIVALVLCVVLSAFFSASETACSAVSSIRLKTLAADGNKKAEKALRLCGNYDSLLTGILVGNNLVNIAGTAIATVIFTEWLKGSGPTVATVVMTVVILLFGEVSPKCLARESPERLAMLFSGPLLILVKIMKPIDLLFVRWRDMLKRLFREDDTGTEIEDEIITMVDEAQNEGDMAENEVELIRSAVEFKDLDAGSIMTPRVDVTALPDTATMEETEQLFLETSYSRIPIYHGDMDHITGVLNEKDYYEKRHNGVDDIREIMTEPVFAPNSISISLLLEHFRTHHTHMVILVDEFGGTDGIVTLEDVLEELVGDIWDEHDDVEEKLVTGKDGSLQADGGMRLDELLQNFSIGNTYNADTVGGWAAEVLRRIPKVGDTFRVENLLCTVTAMDRRRVTEVSIQKQEVTGDAGTEDKGAHENE